MTLVVLGCTDSCVGGLHAVPSPQWCCDCWQALGFVGEVLNVLPGSRKLSRANDSKQAVHQVLRGRAGDLEDFDMLLLETRGCAIDIRRSAGMVRVLLAPDCSAPDCSRMEEAERWLKFLPQRGGWLYRTYRLHRFYTSVVLLVQL